MTVLLGEQYGKRHCVAPTLAAEGIGALGHLHKVLIRAGRDLEIVTPSPPEGCSTGSTIVMSWRVTISVTFAVLLLTEEVVA
jgi:hypothetical protein